MISGRLKELLQSTPVVITGRGAVSCAGLSVNDLWNKAERGQTTVTEKEYTIAGQPQRIAVCPVPPIPQSDAQLPRFHRMDRSVQLARLAASQALNEAALETSGSRPTIGVVVGTSRGPIAKLEEGICLAGAKRYPPSLSADGTIAAVSGALAQAYNLDGPSAVISATCATGVFAIAHAAEQLLLGKADVMLVGATETPLVPSIVAQMAAARMLGSHSNPHLTCRPFDRTRNGLCLGEGSGFLVLESAEYARRRGAKPLAKLSSWGTGVDDSGRANVNESGKGVMLSANRAFSVAGLTADDIDYVNAHGTGTKANDLAEARAIRALFGDRANDLPCTSTKPVTGHCLGATPVLEAIICVEALRHQIVPPTANCHELDDQCEINAQPLHSKPARLRHVLSNSLGFWGFHGSLIISAFEA